MLLAGALVAGGPLLAQQISGPPPTPAEFFGFPLGEDFASYHQVAEYARMLADVSPLASYSRYGESVEGRELFHLVLASEANHLRLGEILAANAELTSQTTSPARADQIARSNPAVVYFSYGVHGNESSSTQSALWSAHDVITNADEMRGVLDSLIIVIDPVANPDGRDRYVTWYRSVVGAAPNPNPETREHREPWPGGRSNHYMFDLNRDWAWMTQPETRARISSWWEWNPQVHVDFHEMSPNSSYFFFPASAPINPIYPEYILDWGARFGQQNSQTFDARGWDYFTGEKYDMFYPGYGDSWPSLHGAIGMTYEQAGGGAAGLAYRRNDAEVLTLDHRIAQHRASGNTTLRTAAAGKTELLLNFAEAHRTAGVGHPDVLIVPNGNPERVEALVEHLEGQGIRVERALVGFRHEDATPYPGHEARREFPAGTIRVPAQQPRGRLAVTLLQPETELRAQYSYDITAWSLPYAYGVEAHQAVSAPPSIWGPASAAGTVSEIGRVQGVPYGYLVPPGDEAAAGVIRYLRAGGLVRTLGTPSRFEGRTWPAGTWYLRGSADDEVARRIEDAGLGGIAVPVLTGRSEEGIDLGSEGNPPLRLPRIGLIGGDGIIPTSYGAHWYYLDNDLQLSFDALLLQDLGDLDLRPYHVLILPDTRVELDEAVSERLSDWIEQGGRLVAVAGGSEAAAELAEVEMRGEGAMERRPDLLRPTREERERQEWADDAHGAILEAHLDPRHPLTWGSSFDQHPDRIFILNGGDRIFEPADNLEAVAWFEDDLEATSGVISGERLARMEEGAWLVSRSYGSGEIILFADDPLFRLFWKATMPLYRNALLIGDL